MEANFTDVLVDGEMTVKLIQIMATGRGMVDRARSYIIGPITVRYVMKHQKHLFQLQTTRVVIQISLSRWMYPQSSLQIRSMIYYLLMMNG